MATFAAMLFLGNLPYDASKADVMELLAPFGRLESLELVIDPVSGRSRGFGFARLDSNVSENEAINTLHQTEWRQRTLRIETYLAKKVHGT